MLWRSVLVGIVLGLLWSCGDAVRGTDSPGDTGRPRAAEPTAGARGESDDGGSSSVGGAPEASRDATVPAQPADAGADVEQACVQVGGDCDEADCCAGATCVTEEGSRFECAAECSFNGECMSGCCATLQDPNVAVCARQLHCQADDAVFHCPDLILVGSDDTFLGEATSDPLATHGVCNLHGAYGSELSPTSIYDPYGPYGSDFSMLSAYNAYTRTPPFLYCVSTEVALANVTKNFFLPNPIDPDELCAELAFHGY